MPTTSQYHMLDTLKAAVPILGGVTLQHLEFADRLLTLGTHAVGLVAAILGTTWLIRDRIKRNNKRRNER